MWPRIGIGINSDMTLPHLNPSMSLAAINQSIAAGGLTSEEVAGLHYKCNAPPAKLPPRAGASRAALRMHLRCIGIATARRALLPPCLHRSGSTSSPATTPVREMWPPSALSRLSRPRRPPLKGTITDRTGTRHLYHACTTPPLGGWSLRANWHPCR